MVGGVIGHFGQAVVFPVDLVKRRGRDRAQVHDLIMAAKAAQEQA